MLVGSLGQWVLIDSGSLASSTSLPPTTRAEEVNWEEKELEESTSECSAVNDPPDRDSCAA